MSSTTMQSQGFMPARPQAVGDALRDLSAAAQRVLAAFWAALLQRKLAAAKVLTPSEEAARVRALASTYVKTDPGFATDLFAAADRHEGAHEL